MQSTNSPQRLFRANGDRIAEIKRKDAHEEDLVDSVSADGNPGEVSLRTLELEKGTYRIVPPNAAHQPT